MTLSLSRLPMDAFIIVNSADVKSDTKIYKKGTKESVLEQITALKDHFGADLANYHALFLGNHDALAAGDDLICFAAEQAYKAFGFKKRMKQDPLLYLFGSVGSFLGAGETLFQKLNELPFDTYINIGFESTDSNTLVEIGKTDYSGTGQRGIQKNDGNQCRV